MKEILWTAIIASVAVGFLMADFLLAKEYLKDHGCHRAPATIAVTAEGAEPHIERTLVLVCDGRVVAVVPPQ